MTPLEFATKHLGKFRQKGEEIVPDLCPYCKGGSSMDKHTFALNMRTGEYNCKRGSCGVKGGFGKLLQDFGEETHERSFEIAPSKAREYLKPKKQISPAQAKVYDYLKRRGFSQETWEKLGVGETEGNIAFPHYDEDGELVLMKFRKPEKYTGKGQKMWCEPGGKSVLFGMHKCVHGLPLVITEGQMDALAVLESGVENVVSVPNGTDDLQWIDNCWDWLKKFKDIIIWPDNDNPGQEHCRKLINRLGAWRCLVVKSPHKDANEHLFKEGKESVKTAVHTAEYVPIAGLVRLADVKAYDPTAAERAPSSIPSVNKKMGGYAMGQLSVWTGINGSGKSTFLGQELAFAIKNGYKVLAYSGELPAAVFRYIIELQMAGPTGLIEAFDSVGKKTYKVLDKTQKKMREWYAPYFFLLDSFGSVTVDNMLEVFEYGARRHNCRVFLVDNLMTTSYGGSKEDFYRKQSEMVGHLKEFAHRFDVHVHLVAHPRKTEGKLSKSDVAGTGDIVNRCDNAFAIHRCSSQEIADTQSAGILTILKDRYGGLQETDLGLQFEPSSRRFYQRETGAHFELWG